MIQPPKKSFCFRCYHIWNRRKEEKPQNCPKCNSPYWHKPRKKTSKQFVLNLQETIIGIHNAIIKLSGGEKGIRDDGGLYNSTYRLINHQARYQNNPLSIGTFILHEFARRHHFNDGNKRTAYVLAKIFMLINRCHLNPEYSDATDFMLNVAKYESKVTFEDIQKWIKENSFSIEEKDIGSYLNKVVVTHILRERENKDEANQNH